MVDGQVQGIFLDEEVLMQGLAVFEAVVQRTNVAPGAEGFFTGTTQHHRMHFGVFDPGIELAVQAADHVQGNGVEAGGAVEGQVTDVVAHVSQHVVWPGIHGRGCLGFNLSSHH